MTHGDNADKNLILVILLNIAIAAMGIVGSVLSGSLLLASDALHNFSDAFSVIIGYIALLIARKMPTNQYTFGYKRSEVIAAFFNALLLIIITIFIVYEAILRFITPNIIVVNIMLYFAIITFFGNLFSTLLLSKHSKKNINIKSVYLHMLADSLSSFCVIIGALIMLFYKIYWVDAGLSILIAGYILKEGLKILNISTKILMESPVKNINLHNIEQKLEAIDSVKNVHHMHVWSISDNDIFLQLHVETQDIMLGKTAAIREQILKILEKEGINHVNIQFETDTCKSKSLICQDEI